MESIGNDSPQYPTDDIESLPITIKEDTNELDKMYGSDTNIPNKLFTNEIIEIFIIMILFIFVSLPFVTRLLQQQLGDTNSVLAARSALFAAMYYIIKNTYLPS